jgi:hypothetical protein
MQTEPAGTIKADTTPPWNILNNTYKGKPDQDKIANLNDTHAECGSGPAGTDYGIPYAAAATSESTRTC